MPLVHLNGTQIFYLQCGYGRPSLVMHGGLGADHTYLHPWLDPLGDRLQLVYYDHRGNGRSGRPPLETITWEQLSADADAIREHLGFERVVLIGHSFGGHVALDYTLRYPERVCHLVLVDTAPAFKHFEEINANLQRKGPTPEMLEAFVKIPADDQEMGRIYHILAPLYFYRYRPELSGQVMGRTIWSASALTRNAVLLEDYDVIERLCEIRVPTLIMVGRDDWIHPPSQAEIMQARIPNAELVIFEESGHLPFVEEPEAFFKTFRDWLSHNLF